MQHLKSKLALAVSAATLTTMAFGHGYVLSPESRSYSCKTGLNTGCGGVQYEPQSIEGPDGSPRFPIGGPEDGTIAAAGSPLWSTLNAQSPSRWYKHDFGSGYQSFEWRFTANHVTNDWRYFITKPDWNPSELLTRDQFDLVPFCEYDGGQVRPPMTITHNCFVPEREGYHVVLAVWDVGDTAASFYNMIDVSFNGTNPDPVDPVDPFAEVGLLSGAFSLQEGDVVSTLVFDENGEIPSLSVSYEATGFTSGGAVAFELAKRINQAGLGYYAGQRDGEVFVPVVGANTVYGSGDITNVETRVEFAPDPDFTFEASVTNVPTSVEFNAMGMLDVPFTVTVNANSQVTATLYDSNGDTVIGDEFTLGGSVDLKLHVHMPREETYTLVVVSTALDTNDTIQATRSVTLVDNRVTEPEDPDTCDATDPMAGMNPEFDFGQTYTGGELVSFNGLVYQAKWWVRGTAPDATDAFELVSDVVLPYSDDTTYNGGDRAVFQGQIFEAKWWTRGSNPTNGPFRLIGDAPSC